VSGVLRSEEGGAPWRRPVTWRWWEAVSVFLGAFLLGHLIGKVLFGEEPSPTAVVIWRAIAELTWIAVLVTWLQVRHPGWVTALGRPARPWSEFRDGAVFGLILYGVVGLAVVVPVSWLLGVMSGQGVVPTPAPFPRTLPPSGVAVRILFALIVAPAAEEFFFRGILFRALRDHQGTSIGVACSAGAFGLVHYVPGSSIGIAVVMAATAAMGVGLAIQYERRRNLFAPLAAHVAYNVLGLVTLLRT
jgi:membrane protease YdiL (CAAX protease family)